MGSPWRFRIHIVPLCTPQMTLFLQVFTLAVHINFTVTKTKTQKPQCNPNQTCRFQWLCLDPCGRSLSFSSCSSPDTTCAFQQVQATPKFNSLTCDLRSRNSKGFWKIRVVVAYLSPGGSGLFLPVPWARIFIPVLVVTERHIDQTLDQTLHWISQMERWERSERLKKMKKVVRSEGVAGNGNFVNKEV